MTPCRKVSRNAGRLVKLRYAVSEAFGTRSGFTGSADEAAAMDWLHEHTPRDAVVLAAPEMGLFIPAWAGRRVVYGHPFETVNAEQTRARVEACFASGTSRTERDVMLTGWNVAFVFVGPRERALGMTEPPGREVFRNATVTICQP